METEKELLKKLGTKKLKELYQFLKSDIEIKSLLKQANVVTISRLGYNNHGPVHARIVALNSLKLLDFISVKPNIIKERLGKIEDVKAILLISAYIHDIGCTISRDEHDLLGTILAQPIARRILKHFYKDEIKVSNFLPFILEAIFCHWGRYHPTSIEAGLISIADACDMTKGRARIPFMIGERDIHEYSAMAIESVRILKGKKKPIQIKVDMSSSAGVFQVEELLLKKIMNSGLDEYIEIISNIQEKGKRYRDIYLR